MENLKNEIEAVRQLGDSIGYGHLMSLASSIWREKLSPDGIESGAFVPVCMYSVKVSDLDMVNRSTAHYDKIVKDFKEH
jgi:hypothetical protein